MSLNVFGAPVDEKAVAQIEEVMKDERAVAGALMADHHLGYSMPIGGVVAYEGAISPSGVGFDIACGNKAVRTNLLASDLGDSVKGLMRAIQKEVAFGIGRSSKEKVDHPLFDDPVWSELPAALKEKARDQLGTVGSGNHYVDLLSDEDGRVWVACHFGSRGFGHTVATRFLKIAYGEDPDDGGLREREDAAVLDVGTPAGDLYIEAMEVAGQYAYAGRDYVVGQVLKLIGAEADFSVHNHHNYAWQEGGQWIVRKGATPLTREPAFIGGSMGDYSVIVRGTGVDIGAMGSAPHGAGRVMSRTKAAGKLRKMWVCPNRNCDFPPFRSEGNAQSGYEKGKCPQCSIPLRKVRMRDTSDAAIDWDATRADLKERNIVVLGAGADEAPGVYKDLTSVLGYHENIEVLHWLSPLGVVMAGPDTYDPYKD